MQLEFEFIFSHLVLTRDPSINIVNKLLWWSDSVDHTWWSCHVWKCGTRIPNMGAQIPG